jgi:ketosteroid isomerase-like protein
MRRLFAIVALVGMLVPAAVWAQAAQAKPAAQTAEQAVTALEKAWVDAINKQDAAWYEKNLAAGFVTTNETGEIRDKAATVARAKAKTYTVTATVDEMKVMVYGDTAIAIGIESDKGTDNGKDASGRFRWTDTWVKINGQWQCVASHSSKITK